MKKPPKPKTKKPVVKRKIGHRPSEKTPEQRDNEEFDMLAMGKEGKPFREEDFVFDDPLDMDDETDMFENDPQF